VSASDAALRELVSAIIADDTAAWRAQLQTAPALACIGFATGATRNSEQGYFLDSIRRWIYSGDTALHFAAAAYRAEAATSLLMAGADIHARNRHGQKPLHSAAAGLSGSPAGNPRAQADTIAALIQAGADPNATDKRGVAPLHIAVRTLSSASVRALLEHGADPALPNGNGSTPMLLAISTTGRGGSGSPEAKAEQEKIVRLLQESAAASAQ
jgi:hypothetical protein